MDYQQFFALQRPLIDADLDRLSTMDGVNAEELCWLVEMWTTGPLEILAIATPNLLSVLGTGFFHAFHPAVDERTRKSRQSGTLAVVSMQAKGLDDCLRRFQEAHNQLLRKNQQAAAAFGRLLCRFHPDTVAFAER